MARTNMEWYQSQEDTATPSLRGSVNCSRCLLPGKRQSFQHRSALLSSMSRLLSVVTILLLAANAQAAGHVVQAFTAQLT